MEQRVSGMEKGVGLLGVMSVSAMGLVRGSSSSTSLLDTISRMVLPVSPTKQCFSDLQPLHSTPLHST